ncbi:MAG: hypothetical protein IMZ58_03935 [Thermoplasmata archaeon]|nr:hypothetical protein [Thermoplasmata archaeon]
MKQNEELGNKGNFKGRFVWRLATIVVVFVMIGSGSVWYLSIDKSNPEITTSNRNIIALEAPLLLPLGENGTRSSFLDQEAGISAYTNVGTTINLTLARNAFRTIENESTDYIIGSVPLPDYSESEDVHCYVHQDGWIVSYYLKTEPIGKIFDGVDYTTDGQITDTKLNDGIDAVCEAAAVVPGNINYFDFEWPNAQKMMIVGDAIWGYPGGPNTFNLTLPTDFTFYERSFCHYSVNSCSYSQLYINQQQISYVYHSFNYGSLSSSQLPSGPTNIIKLTSNCGSSQQTSAMILLLYKE